MEKIYGFATLNNTSCPFTYEDGVATFYAGVNGVPLPENGIHDFIAVDYSNKQYYFHLSLPITWTGYVMIDGEGKSQEYINFIYGVDIDYYIEDYKRNAQYSRLDFRFPELDYFIPSKTSIEDLQNCTFKGKYYSYFDEDFAYLESTIKFKLFTETHINKSISFNMHTESVLRLLFDETTDLKYVVKLYNKVVNLFSFICNRRNASVESAVLNDKSILHCNNRIVEPFEDENIIKKTLPFRYLEKGFSELFKLILSDEISINNIHSSEKKKHLIDLEYSLSVTSSFENYSRKWLPEISSDTTIQCYKEAYDLISNYSQEFTGKKKNKFNQILRYLNSPEISLSTKIIKIYSGYNGWGGCKEYLSNYFGDDIVALAENVNEWRNELAHNKNEYAPVRETIDGILLLDIMNYCLILYKCGYSKEIIQLIVEKVFKLSKRH